MEIKAVGKSDFDAIYKKNARQVYLTALYYCGNHHAAEEIVQTVFMKLYTSIDTVNENAIRSWLMSAARNTAINYKRDLQKEELREEIEFTDENVQVEEKLMEKLCQEEYRQLMERIFVDLYRVNPRWYEAVCYTYVLEKPQKEVAEIMGIKLEVLHSMLYRAKQWIRKHYGDQFECLNKK